MFLISTTIIVIFLSLPLFSPSFPINFLTAGYPQKHFVVVDLEKIIFQLKFRTIADIDKH